VFVNASSSAENFSLGLGLRKIPFIIIHFIAFLHAIEN
jgi:hypothetical protein